MKNLHRQLIRLKKSIPFFDYPLVDTRHHYEPFFIIGSGRSGNTILRRILQANPHVHIPPETYVLGDIIKTFKNNANLYWPNLVNLLLSKFQFHPEFETFAVDLRPLQLELANTPKQNRSLSFFLDSFYRYHARKVAAKISVRWGDKTPLNTFSLDTIAAVFPNAQFISIVRDGCDVVSSYLKSGIYTELDAAASRWRNSIDIIDAFRAKNPSKVIEIYYEDLVTQPEDTSRKVCQFLHLEFTVDMLSSEQQSGNMGDVGMHKHHKNVSKTITGESIGKGRRTLNHQQKKQLHKLLKNHMEKLNYPACID